MNKLKGLFNRPAIFLAISFIVGTVIGLIILGWWLWPVKWIDSSPMQLQIDYKRDYLCMTIDSYIRNQDEELLNMRWKGLGNTAPEMLKMLTPALCRFKSTEEIENFKTIKGIAEPLIESANEVKPTNEDETNTKTSYLPIALFFVIIITVGGGFAYFLLRRGKLEGVYTGKSEKRKQTKKKTGAEISEAPKVQAEEEPPLAQFMTTYRLSDDLYDESFSIDSPTGEFLGECGVGIAETIGVGEPKKVTALEIWLFDKNDIQTITKVLMSEHAFNDQTIKQRLTSKGEVILVKPGQRFIVETATLQMEARVIDMIYGRGPLPENSFFSRLTLEISVWNKSVE